MLQQLSQWMLKLARQAPVFSTYDTQRVVLRIKLPAEAQVLSFLTPISECLPSLTGQLEFRYCKFWAVGR